MIERGDVELLVSAEEALQGLIKSERIVTALPDSPARTQLLAMIKDHIVKGRVLIEQFRSVITQPS